MKNSTNSQFIESNSKQTIKLTKTITLLINQKITLRQWQKAHGYPCIGKRRVHHSLRSFQSTSLHQCSWHPKLKHTKTWASQEILTFLPLCSPHHLPIDQPFNKVWTPLDDILVKPIRAIKTQIVYLLPASSSCITISI
ncbi:hypothetical protein SLEP1_g56782 [Rubroshorea leprosula]|uniref:Uncharacterized protein n=1 Tax=Rubroshorea leprosula TaxID=152421 RepID=A0AAV5MMR5_9ROSI|nr:hypothetical protein SLEP1_g56782 [Rubroshorea leprosula]